MGLELGSEEFLEKNPKILALNPGAAGSVGCLGAIRASAG